MYLKVSLFIYLHVNLALQNVRVTFSSSHGWCMSQLWFSPWISLSCLAFYLKGTISYLGMAGLAQRHIGLNTKTKQQEPQVSFSSCNEVK